MFWLNSLRKETQIYFIPDNFKIISYLKDIELKSEFMEFKRSYKLEGERLNRQKL